MARGFRMGVGGGGPLVPQNFQFPPSKGWSWSKNSYNGTVTLTDNEMSAENMAVYCEVIFAPSFKPSNQARTISVTFGRNGYLSSALYVNGALAADYSGNATTQTLTATLPAGSTSFYIKVANYWGESTNKKITINSATIY